MSGIKRIDVRFVRVVLMGLLAAFVLSACASDGGSSEAAATDTPPPSGSKFAKVELGSDDNDVRKVLGNPDDTNNYQTGKSWIPFYYGSDTHRTDWLYEGQGRIVFSRNRYSGGLKVIRVMYNPDDKL